MERMEEERPPLGSWGRLYAAVVVSAVLHIALVALFSGWAY